MFEKIGRSAEKVVSTLSVSRRGFLGKTAKLAAGAGAALSCLAATSAEASPGELYYWGTYECPDGTFESKGFKTYCHNGYRGCKLVYCSYIGPWS